MRTGNAPRAADLSDNISCLDLLADLDQDLRLMPESTIDAPAVVNEGCVPSDFERASKNDHPGRRGVDGQPRAAAKINP